MVLIFNLFRPYPPSYVNKEIDFIKSISIMGWFSFSVTTRIYYRFFDKLGFPLLWWFFFPFLIWNKTFSRASVWWLLFSYTFRIYIRNHIVTLLTSSLPLSSLNKSSCISVVHSWLLPNSHRRGINFWT